MPLTSLAVIAVTVVVCAFVSGVFGMAGGMVLLGVLLVYFDVATAMVTFSVIQGSGNAFRVWQWRRFILWPIFWRYAVGAAIAFAVMRVVAYVPDKATVYLLLGLLLFMIEVLPAAWRPSIEWRGVPFASGFLTTVVQFMAGVGGMFLDIFFQKSALDRKTTNATKAVTQVFSHVLRASYFVSLEGLGGFDPVLAGAGVGLAFVGTSLAPYVIERMSDHGFRRWTRVIILIIAAVYVARGGLMLWRG